MSDIEEKTKHQNPFAIMPADLIADCEIKPMEKMVYMALASYMNVDRYCYPYIQTISSKLGVSYRTVTRALNSLKQAGYIKVHNQWKGNGGQVANIYYLPLTPRTVMTYPLGQDSPTPRTSVTHLTIQSEENINLKDLKKSRAAQKMEFATKAANDTLSNEQIERQMEYQRTEQMAKLDRLRLAREEKEKSIGLII